MIMSERDYYERRETNNSIRLMFEGAIDNKFTDENIEILNENGLLVDSIEPIDWLENGIFVTFKKTEKYSNDSLANLAIRMK